MSRRAKPAPSPAQVHAPVFAALGDRTRLLLVERLSQGQPRSIMELTEGFKLTRQAVTKHLRVLEGAGLVQSMRQGREVRFEFTAQPLEHARTYLDDVARQWGATLDNLKAFVENDPSA